MPDIVIAQNETLPNATQTRYRDMGDATHALVTYAETEVRNIRVAGSDVSPTNPVPVDEIIRTESAWTTLMASTVFDGTPATENSNTHDVSEYGALWVHIYIDSTGAPTDVRVLPEFQGVGHWWDYEEGLWASLMWEDTDTANGIRKAFLLPCGGQDTVRFRVITTGTGPGATFEVSIHVRAFRGNFGVGHA
jgi:hypothetical protein